MNQPMIQRDTAPQQQPRALVVDDRVDVAMGLGLLLKRLGYEVKVAYKAHEALEKGKDFLPDVVFLDIGLPDLSGYEVCLEMRRSEWGAKAFIVAVTGRTDAADILRAANTGFDRHVGKPMDLSTLGDILRIVATRT